MAHNRDSAEQGIHKLREAEVDPRRALSREAPARLMLEGLRGRLKEFPFLVNGVRKARGWKQKTFRSSLRSEYWRLMKPLPPLPLQVDPAPVRIQEVEINKNCNLNCTMCNTQLSTRKQANMDLALFERILLAHRRRGHQRFELLLHTIGEPLLNPLLGEYFALLRKHKLKVFFSSNLLMLEQKIDVLREFADVISTFRFSIDGASKETYEKIRYPGKFDRLMESLELFKSVNRDGRYFRDVWVDSIVSTDVRHELGYHFEFYGQYVPLENIRLHLVDGLSPDNSYFFEHTILKAHVVPTAPCWQLVGPMQILLDGRASSCCRDYNGDLIYGDVNHDDPEDLVNAAPIVELRRQHNEGRIPAGSLCASCYMVDRRVKGLFELFSTRLVAKYARSWNVDLMQQRYDRFFELFAERIPPVREFVSLLA